MQGKQAQKPKIIFLLGGPGSGKGTQSEIMVRKYHFFHYSTGDLLRDFIKTDCEEAEKIRNILKEGKLAPSTMLVEIVKKKIFENGPNGNVFLIDGFPRSEENFNAWKQVMQDDVEVKTLLNLDCTIETLEKRLIQRGKTSQRDDDNRQTILKRFKTFKDQTEPFIKYYTENEGHIHTVDGEQAVEIVTETIRKVLVDEEIL